MNRKRIGIALLLCLGILAAGCGISADGKGTEAVPPSGSAERKPAAAQDQKAPLGTRQNPVPAGTAVKVGKEWQVTLLEINPDAWEVLKAENMFNTTPCGRIFVSRSPAGYHNLSVLAPGFVVRYGDCGGRSAGTLTG